MKISELFRRDISRTIEEVIKVDLADEHIVALEIDEYVVTDHIEGELEEFLEVFQETINNPSERTNVWISGFFGSGKSSFAKVLGYLLENRTVQGRPVRQRFKARCASSRIEALLNTIHAQVPTVTVFLDLSQSQNVLHEGEPVVLPVYRALLERLGYSRNILLAELEIALEGDGHLEEFVEAFAKVTEGKRWDDRRHVLLARNEASHALHVLHPETYNQPDSWARSASDPEVTENWFADRALELLRRRGDGAQRLALVVDEAGQYVARDVHRMLHLQGLAQAIQKKRGSLWLIVTAQERLNDVVDSLEGRQVELARAQDRFPIRTDLLPSDIDDVAGRRVLDKSDSGQAAVGNLIERHRGQLLAGTRLQSPTRADEPPFDDLVRLYPLLPYQIQLLIDAVDQRRRQGGAGPTLGGSNRTIIKHAQQLITHPVVGLGEHDIGALVTLDRSYDLLEETIPTSWRAEVEQVADKYGTDALEARIMKVVALALDVPALPLTAENLAAMLHPGIDAESLRPQIPDALAHLVADDRLRESDEGYRLQSPEQKSWEQMRKGIEMRPADAVRLRRELLRDALAGLSVTRGRAFKVAATVEGERITDGEIELAITEADGPDRDALRAESRAAQSRISWVYSLSPETYTGLEDLFRSQEMIRRRDVPTKTSADVELLGDERNRFGRGQAAAVTRFTRDLRNGEILFRGEASDTTDATNLRACAQRIVESRLDDLYPRLDEFAASLTPSDVLIVLTADDLADLPAPLGEDVLGLVRLTPQGRELVTETGPIAELVAAVKERVVYGQDPSGKYLEERFAAPPYGAPVEVTRAVLAAAVRAGLLEVLAGGQRLASRTDPRVEKAFRTLPAFRAAGFRPPREGEPELELRTELAEKLGTLTGTTPPIATNSLADAVRDTFLPGTTRCTKVEATLRGASLPTSDVVSRTAELLTRLRDESDGDVVRTARESWSDLAAGRDALAVLERVVDEHLPALRLALAEVGRGVDRLPDEAQAAHAGLADRLQAANYASDLAEIRSLTEQLVEARRTRSEAILAEMRTKLAAGRTELRQRFAEVGDERLDEALRDLDALEPAPETGDRDPATLAGGLAAIDRTTAAVCTRLEELAADGRLARVRVTDVVTRPIRTEADLDQALNQIRDAVAAQLADGKEVRLQ